MHLATPTRSRKCSRRPPTSCTPARERRILEPIVGRHSVILLDEDPHLEQRKLLLPAFHGERMQRLAGLMSRAGASARSPPGRAKQPIALHPRLQRLTLEIILRAVFGLEQGAQLDALRELLTRDPRVRREPAVAAAAPARSADEPRADGLDRARFGPMARLAQVDELIFELIEERRAAR